MAYIGNSPGVSSQRIVTTVTATAGQTTFTPSSGYTVGYLDVYLNGIKLINGTDYTASDGSTVVLTDAAALDDVVELMAYIPRGLSDGYTKSEADARYDATGAASTAQSAAQTYAAGLVDDLSGVTNASGARTNLGLGSLATKSTIGTADITDGAVTAAKLAAGAAVPSQTGQSGKYLTTDGTNASWGTITQPTPAAVSDQANTSTGYFALPVGTTAQRPSSPAVGMVRFNTDLNHLEEYRSNVWQPLSNVFSAEGGVETTIDVSGTLYKVHTFTSSSTFTVQSGTAQVDYLIVAGGGGGGNGNPAADGNGGGGAGGVLTQSLTIGSGTYSILVGAGGAAGAVGAGNFGVTGGNSSFFNQVAIGGGGGGSDTGSGLSGGSGGGAGCAGTYSGIRAGGSNTAGQGFSGGGAYNGAGPGGGGGGGGGASAVGATGQGSNTVGGNGGAGVSSSINGTATVYAGGGGGSSWTNSGGSGGSGGGGSGGSRTGAYGGTSGASNRGGGGGAASAGYLAGNGGSGIVIIRYAI